MNRSIGIVFAGLLSVLLGSAAAQTVALDPTVNPKVMVVNGDPIYAFEISIVLRDVLDRAGTPTGGKPSQEALDVATQRVIEQKLLAQEARRFGLKADEDTVQQQVASAARQAGSRQALERSLSAAGTTITQLESFYREMLLGQVFIARQIRPTVSVSDDEIQEFIEANPKISEIEEQVRARHILITVPQDADLETDRRALERAEEARRRALAGEDFAALARELSEGPSASAGGDLGFFTRDRMLPNFAEAAFELEVGEISPVVRTSFGYHVIQVVDRREAGSLGDEEVRERARRAVANRKIAKVVGELLRGLYENATIKELDSGQGS